MPEMINGKIIPNDLMMSCGNVGTSMSCTSDPPLMEASLYQKIIPKALLCRSKRN